jgi:hypothetical protein
MCTDHHTQKLYKHNKALLGLLRSSRWKEQALPKYQQQMYQLMLRHITETFKVYMF